MANVVTKKYTTNGTFTAPAEVTQVTVICRPRKPRQIGHGSVGLLSDGTAYAWGDNVSGQVGDGTVVAKSSPILVLGGLKFRSLVVLTSDARLGITNEGAAYAWGSNLLGLLGDGTVAAKSSPVLVLGGLRFKKVSSGGSAGFGLDAAGAVYAWGSNSSGALGVGDVNPRSSPVAVLGGIVFKEIGSSCGLDINGAAYGWGANNSGQIGDGTVVAKSSPVLVLGGLTFDAIAQNAATSHAALTADGDLYAWGSNSNGLLGVGDVAARSSPVLVLGGLKWRKVVGGSSSYLGLTTSGTLYAWGLNSSGQLGLGDTTNRSSPVAVLGGLSVVDIYGGSGGFLASTTDGKLYGWGVNDKGELGLGDITNRSSPVAVLGGRTFSKIDPASSHTFTVVPGSSYTVTVNSLTPMFAYTELHQFPCEEILVQYEA